MMLARVRWSAQRVCLEGMELRAPDTSNGIASTDGSSWATTGQSWVVARFVGTPAAGRASITQGNEWRQPLECKLLPP
jgi:hypothetical protein